MNPVDAQQVALDNALVAPKNRIIPRLLDQEFDGPLSDEEIVTFINELGHKGDIKSVTNVAIKISKRETNIHQAGDSSEGANLELKVLGEPKGKSIDTSKGTGLKQVVLDVSKENSFESEYESWGDSDDDNDDDDDQQSNDKRTKSHDDDKDSDIDKTDNDEEDEFIHTPDNYVPTDDENVDDDAFECINKEMYSDVNMELKDSKREGEGKDDEEMTDAELENLSQEVTEATISTTTATNSTTLTAIHQRFSHVENEAKTLKNINHSSAIHTDVKFKVPTIVKECLGTSLDDAFHKALWKHTAELVKECSVLADVTYVLQQQQKPQKSVADIQSILEDEDAMEKGIAEKLKKRKTNDVDKDEDPHAESNQGLKRKKTGKETKPSKKAKSTETSKGTTKSQPKSTCNAFVMNRLQVSDLIKYILVGPAYNILKGTCRSYVKLEYNMEECYKALTDQLDWNNPEGDKYPFDLSKPLPQIQSKNLQIVLVDYFSNNDLAYLQGESTGRTYTTSLTKIKDVKYDLNGIEDMVPNFSSPIKVAYDKNALLDSSTCNPEESRRRIVHFVAALRHIVIQKRVEDLQFGVESYQKKLNISKPTTREEELSRRAPYTTLLDPQGVIYENKLNRKRLIRSDELYKFSDGTLLSIWDTLHDMAIN
nr:hypothetical protein [Tanacetum cinerariifolium]